jgi:hypothetical protein
MYFDNNCGIMHLTAAQKDRLIHRDEPGYASDRRTNDYLVRQALKEFLDLEDVNLILKTLPKEQIEKVLTDDAVFGLLALAKDLVALLGPGEDSYYVVPSSEDGNPPVKMSKNDSHRADRLSNWIHGFEQLRNEFFVRGGNYENFENMRASKLKVPYKKIEK